MARLTRDQAEARRSRVLELRPILAELIPLHQQPHAGGTRTDNIAIARALNARGVLNLTGKEWTKGDVSNFTIRDLVDKGTVQSDESPREDVMEEPSAPCDRPAIDVSEIDSAPADSPFPETGTMEVPSETLEICDRPMTDHERAALPDDLVALLSNAYASGELSSLLEWWHAEKGGPMATIKRPRFTGERTNSGLLLNRALKNLAFAKAKGENMSLSQLVELLLWRYLGEPAEFVASDE